MKELYKKTKKTLIQSKVTTNTNLRTQYLNLWWAFWVVNSIAGSVSFRLSLYSETIEELLFLGIFNIALSVWFFLTGFLAIKVIKDYAKVEPLLVEVLKGDKTARSEEK